MYCGKPSPALILSNNFACAISLATMIVPDKLNLVVTGYFDSSAISSFIDLFNGESVKLWSYIIPLVLIIVGIFLMKKARNSAPIGEAYKAGMIYRGFRGRI